MLNRSFIFAKGLTEEMERALWARGVVSWEVLRAHPGEAGEVIGMTKAQKLVEAVSEAQQARDKGDRAWFRANWPERETWRLWRGLCTPEQVALVDIETYCIVIALRRGRARAAFERWSLPAGPLREPRRL